MAKDFPFEGSIDDVRSYHRPVLRRKSGVNSEKFPNEISRRDGDDVAPVNRVELQDVARGRAAELIRYAFPAPSDRARAKEASKWLGYSEAAVLRWLSCESGVPFEVVFAIGAKIGAFAVLEVMTMGGKSRAHFLNKIIQGARRVVS